MNENKPITVLLASPSYDGRFDVRFLDSLINTISLCEKHNIKILPYFLCYDSLIQRVRNDYFRTAYQSGVDVLFFIDSDIGWNPQDFVKLVMSDLDMIGGTYRKKTDEEELYAFKSLGENPDDYNIVPDNNGILEVAGLGCGFLKISKRCVNMLFENEPNYYTDGESDDKPPRITKSICDCVVNSNNHFVSEDIIIGYKWMQLGGKVYLDTNINLTHVGNKEYKGSVKNWLSDWKIKFDKQKLNRDESASQSSGCQSSGCLFTNYFTNEIPQNDDVLDDAFKVL
jgi:hypothetical protein